MKINIGCVIPGHTPKNISGHEVPEDQKICFQYVRKVVNRLRGPKYVIVGWCKCEETELNLALKKLKDKIKVNHEN